MREKKNQYTSYEDATIWVGTYNLNGRSPGSESLLPWLFPVDGQCRGSMAMYSSVLITMRLSSIGREPSMLVLGFQEIVPLTPSMIMATDPEKK
jgi:hypothetical protein